MTLREPTCAKTSNHALHVRLFANQITPNCFVLGDFFSLKRFGRCSWLSAILLMAMMVERSCLGTQLLPSKILSPTIPELHVQCYGLWGRNKLAQLGRNQKWEATNNCHQQGIISKGSWVSQQSWVAPEIVPDARPLLPKAAFFMGDMRDGLPMVCFASCAVLYSCFM